VPGRGIESEWRFHSGDHAGCKGVLMETTRAGAEIEVDPFLEAVEQAVRAAPRLRPEVRDRIVNLLRQG
jgi:hypothetical protein